MNIISFREQIITDIFEKRNSTLADVNLVAEVEVERNHKSFEIESRGRCTRCYKKNSERNGTAYAMKMTLRQKMRWQVCDEKSLCVKCFSKTHNCARKR
jgi:hypothetical protein